MHDATVTILIMQIRTDTLESIHIVRNLTQVSSKTGLNYQPHNIKQFSKGAVMTN